MSWYDFFIGKSLDEEPGWCVPCSFFCARVWAVKRHTPIRIVEYKIDENTNHFQAEAKISGAWTPLSEFWNGRCMVVRPWKRHYPNAPILRYLTLQEAEAEQDILLNEV